MPYEVFKGKGSQQFDDRSRVTLSRAGVFRLSEAAYELMGKPSHMKFAYDEAAKSIALLPGKPTDRHSYSVITKGRARLLHGMAFCRHIGIDLETRWRWEGVWNGEALELAVVSD